MKLSKETTATWTLLTLPKLIQHRLRRRPTLHVPYVLWSLRSQPSATAAKACSARNASLHGDKGTSHVQRNAKETTQLISKLHTDM